MSNLKINNQSGIKLGPVEDHLNEFYPYAKEKMGFNQDPDFNFISDSENSQDTLGKTAYYDPSNYSVTIYVDGRHPKDILRSISHELVHHSQNCRGEFSGASMGSVGEQGYAQKDEHLREMEREAYEKGNMIFRDWEDTFKLQKETIYHRLNESWGFGVLNENSKYQNTVKAKHSANKKRVNNLGANKTKAAPFDKDTSSKRAKSAPPSAGGVLENGEKPIMNNKTIEEITRGVLKQMKLDEAKPDFLDLDKDGDKEEPMKKAAKEKKNEVSYMGAEDQSAESATSEDAAAEILKAVEMLKQMGVDVPPDIQARIEQMVDDPEFAEVFGKVKADAMSGTDVGDPDYTGNFELEEKCGDDEMSYNREDDEEDELYESKKTLKSKLKTARRQQDKKEARRIKKEINESKTLTDSMIHRKSNINSKLMEKWFKK
jgi:hypothetical protein